MSIPPIDTNMLSKNFELLVTILSFFMIPKSGKNMLTNLEKKISKLIKWTYNKKSFRRWKNLGNFTDKIFSNLSMFKFKYRVQGI